MHKLSQQPQQQLLCVKEACIMSKHTPAEPQLQHAGSSIGFVFILSSSLTCTWSGCKNRKDMFPQQLNSAENNLMKSFVNEEL